MTTHVSDTASVFRKWELRGDARPAEIPFRSPAGRCEDHSDKAVNPGSVRQPTMKRLDLLPLAARSTRTISEADDRTDKAKGQRRWLWNDRWGESNLHGLRT